MYTREDIHIKMIPERINIQCMAIEDYYYIWSLCHREKNVHICKQKLFSGSVFHLEFNADCAANSVYLFHSVTVTQVYNDKL